MFRIDVIVFHIYIYYTFLCVNNLGPLTYWKSNKTSILKWNYSPDCYVHLLNQNFSTGPASIGQANAKWYAAGIPSNIINTESSADIVFYAGTKEELIQADGDTFGTLTDQSNGHTLLDTVENTSSECDYYEYNGSKRYLWHINSGISGIIKKDNRTTYNYYKTGLHEYGHLLGWYGHSSNSNDIMYSLGSEVIQLTNRDKNHILQVY